MKLSDSKESLEIADPRISTTESKDANRERLESYTREVIRVITSSVDKCPPIIRVRPRHRCLSSLTIVSECARFFGESSRIILPTMTTSIRFVFHLFLDSFSYGSGHRAFRSLAQH